MCCSAELNETGYGIMVITPDNFDKPWLHFEAGAISKSVDKAYVSPFLFNIEPSRLVGPLQQFQATINDRDDILRLLGSINSRLPDDRQLPFEILNREFELLWPDLKKKLDKAAETQDLENPHRLSVALQRRRCGAAAGGHEHEGGLDRHRGRRPQRPQRRLEEGAAAKHGSRADRHLRHAGVGGRQRGERGIEANLGVEIGQGPVQRNS
jgi:hypothetical protein